MLAIQRAFVASMLLLPFAAVTASAQDFVDYRVPSEVKQEHGRPPEDSARPGETFFYRGVEAASKGDPKLAAGMFRVSASWAYKPAQYNLGVMYFKGEGVPRDKALGMAWFALAAERSEDAAYAAARDAAYADMSADEFAQANVLWRDMRKTYGDASALKRARNRWLQSRAEMTGSRVGGGTGPLAVGGRTGQATSKIWQTTSFSITGAGAADGSIAYRQLRATDNPYDVRFKERKGTVTVEDVIPAGDGGSPPEQHKQFRFI